MPQTKRWFPPLRAAGAKARLAALAAVVVVFVLAWPAHAAGPAQAPASRPAPAKAAAVAPAKLVPLRAGAAGPAAPASQPAEPLAITHGPYLQNPDADGVTVVWFTNRKCVSHVEFGPGDKLSSTARTSRHGLFDAYTQAHVVRLSGLKPGTTYHYRACSKEIANFQPYKVTFGQEVASPCGSFTTLDARPRPFSFLMVNDIHGKAPALSALLAGASWRGVDLVFLNGDSVSYMESDKHLFDGFVDACAARFASSVPFVFVRGNHETRGLMARSLDDYFPPRDGRYYYAFSHGGVRFVVLDTGEDKPDDAPVYAGLVNFDAYRLEQARWLEAETASPAFRDARWRIVVCHIPPWGGINWHGETHLRKVWGPVLNRAGVDLMLCGHLHHHVYVQPRAGANAFPILCNTNLALLRVDVDRSLRLHVSGAGGKTIDSFTLPGAGGRRVPATQPAQRKETP